MTLAFFSYSAVDHKGVTRHGKLEANDTQHAVELLLQKNMYAFEISPSEVTNVFSTGRFRLGNRANSDPKFREEFYRKSAVLLSAGISVDRVMRILSAAQSKKLKHGIAKDIEQQISSGNSFSSAVQAEIKHTSVAEVTAIRTAEKTGKLAETLLSLAMQLEQQRELRAKLMSMMVYPLFLMALIPLVLIFVAVVLVPNIAPLFENSGREPPLMLAIFVYISAVFKTNPVAISVLLTAALTGLVALLQNRSVRQNFGQILFSLPILSKLRTQHRLQAFCQSMGTLLANGTTLQDALTAIASGEDETKIQRARDTVSEGGLLATALLNNGLLDEESAQIIAIGEDSNQLPNMFLHIATTTQKSYAAKLERLLTLLVPVLTLFIGLVVGGVMVSVMSALLAVSEVPLQ